MEKALVIIGVLVLIAAAVTGWLTARQQSAVANGWRHKDIAEVATNRGLSTTLATARESIATLDGEVTSLNKQIGTLDGAVSGLQGQLSTVATQKEKAVDQNTALTQLLSAAGAVSTDLQTCVQDTNYFDSELLNDITYGNVLSDPSLTSNAANADAVCSTAETADQQLQSAIAAETGT